MLQVVATLAAGIGAGYGVFSSWFESVLSFILSNELNSASLGLTIWKSIAAVSIGIAASRVAFYVSYLAGSPIHAAIGKKMQIVNNTRMISNHVNRSTSKAKDAVESSGLENLNVRSRTLQAGENLSLTVVVHDSSSLDELLEKLETVHSAVLGYPMAIEFRSIAGHSMAKFDNLTQAMNYLKPSFSANRLGLDRELAIKQTGVGGERVVKESMLAKFVAKQSAISLSVLAVAESIDPTGTPIKFHGREYNNLTELIQLFDFFVAQEVSQKIKTSRALGISRPQSVNVPELKAAAFAVATETRLSFTVARFGL